MEGKVPCGIPWVFPRIGHRHDALVVEVAPMAVAQLFPALRRLRHRGIAIQPVIHNVVEKLFSPHHAGERLALHEPFIWAHLSRLHGGVKFISLLDARLEDSVKILEWPTRALRAWPQKSEPDLVCFARSHDPMKDRSGLGSLVVGIHRRAVAMDDATVEGVFRKR